MPTGEAFVRLVRRKSPDEAVHSTANLKRSDQQWQAVDPAAARDGVAVRRDRTILAANPGGDARAAAS